jgi:hypothetical protein
MGGNPIRRTSVVRRLISSGHRGVLGNSLLRPFSPRKVNNLSPRNRPRIDMPAERTVSPARTLMTALAACGIQPETEVTGGPWTAPPAADFSSDSDIPSSSRPEEE